MTSLIDTQVEDGVAVVTLNDPGRRNAFTPEMVTEMIETFDRLEADDECGAVVVTGAAPAFCAGADLSHLSVASEAGLRDIYQGFLRVAHSPLPTVAAVNGAAVGAGLNLALACDVRIMGESGRFDTRFVKLGIHPGGGHTWMLQRLGGPQTTAAMVMFSQVVSGEDAVRLGLAWQCVADDELLASAQAFAARAAAGPHRLVRLVKETIRDMASIDTHHEAVDREVGVQAQSITDPEFRQRLDAAREQITGTKP